MKTPVSYIEKEHGGPGSVASVDVLPSKVARPSHDTSEKTARSFPIWVKRIS
jgi:hypothetical protein